MKSASNLLAIKIQVIAKTRNSTRLTWIYRRALTSEVSLTLIK